MTLLDPASVTRVALDYMNDDHRDFTLALNMLDQHLVDGDITAASTVLDDVVHHTREHFAREERDMRTLRFPPYPIHKGEHDHLVTELEDVFQRWVESRDITWLRGYLADRLTPWFLQHVATMDVVTARYVAMHRETAAA